MKVEPVDVEFEAEVSHLAGPQRRGESVEDHLARIARVRALLHGEGQLLADARTSGYAHGAADAFDRICARLPKKGEFVGNCCEHCAAIENFLDTEAAR